MDNRGFTLIELLAVIVLIAIIAVIGSYGVTGVNNAIKESLWNSKKDLIVSAAVKYGEDHESYFDFCNYQFTIGDQTFTENTADCFTVPVQTLLDQKYLSSRDTKVDAEGNEYKVIINDVDQTMDVNALNVKIYRVDGVVYADFLDSNVNLLEID